LVRHHLGVKLRIKDARFLLTDIVVQSHIRVLTQERDRDQVKHGHQCHKEVGQVPNEGELRNRTHINHHHHKEAEDRQGPTTLTDEVHVHFAIEVVTNDGTKGEKEHHDRDEVIGPTTQLAR